MTRWPVYAAAALAALSWALATGWPWPVYLAAWAIWRTVCSWQEAEE